MIIARPVANHIARPHLKSASLTLVVTVHEPYLQWLPSLLASVRQQNLAVRKMLVCDDCHPAQLDQEWEVLHGVWHDPNAARNAALEHITSEWVVFWDADNVMPGDYLQTVAVAAEHSKRKTAILYPSVVRVTDDHKVGFRADAELWDYWKAKERSMADTCSAWKVLALRQLPEVFRAGCSPLDDYCLVQRLTELGWKGEPIPSTVALRDHPLRRSITTRPQTANTLWQARRHAIITPWSARWHCCEELASWFLKAELPPQTNIVWIDNSGDAKFETWLWRLAAKLRKRRQIQSIEIRGVHGRAKDQTYEAIHTQVARLYNLAMTGRTEDIIITLEDDVIPPLDGMQKLCEPFLPFTKVAVVAGAYPTRGQPERVAASTTPDRWGSMPTMDSLSDQVQPIGMVPGGFTAWAGWALQKALPFHTTEQPKLGWDGTASRELNLAGCGLFLHGGVRCLHRTA